MSRPNQVRDKQGRFLTGVSGNPRGRTPEIAKVRKLLEPHRDELVKTAVMLALGGDAAALRVCLDKLAPAPKASLEPVRIPGLVNADTLTVKATAILEAIGAGAVAPDIGAALISALGNVARVIEVDELAARVAALEAQQGGMRNVTETQNCGA